MAHLRVAVLKWNIDLTTDEAQRVALRVREELIPRLKSKPGFISYQGFVDSEQPRTTIVVVTWASAEQAEVGMQEAVAWTQEHASRYLAGREGYSGEVILS